MDRISELPEELRLKILSFLTTKEAVSTSTLSKQWEFLWRWLPNLEYDFNNFMSKVAFREYINKNLPLHRAPVLDRFSLKLYHASLEPDDIKTWVETAVSRCVRELKIRQSTIQSFRRTVFLPSSLYTCKSLSSLYTCKSLSTLILRGKKVIVDVPLVGSLPSLKKLDLQHVTYSNQDALPLLISYCPILEDLVIKRCEDDNSSQLVVTAPLLQRLSLSVPRIRSSGGYVIVTPSLKRFYFNDRRGGFSYLGKDMPKLEKAVIIVSHGVEKLLESITSVKRLFLKANFTSEQESLYPAGIVFNQLERLKLSIDDPHWPQLLFRLLEDSPKLRGLKIFTHRGLDDHAPFSWNNVSVPKCLLESLESFQFRGYQGRSVERDFLSYLFKNACCLKYSLIK